MKIIKKSLILLITLLLVIPYNAIFADDEEMGPLGGNGDNIFLNIAYDLQNKTNGENLIISYTIEESELKEAYVTYDHDQVAALIPVEKANLTDYQKEKVNEFNDKVDVSIDEDGQSFVLKIKDGKELNIKGFIDSKIPALVSCTTNLKIIGNGTMNVTLIPEPIVVEEENSGPTFNATALMKVSLIKATGKTTIGDANFSLKMKLGTSFPDECTKFVDVECIKAKEIALKNTTLDINTRNLAFIFEIDEPLTADKDILLIEDSIVTFENKFLNDQDRASRECLLIGFDVNINDDDFKNANVTVKDSTLKIKINDPSTEKTSIIEGSVIDLPDESSLNFINSSLDYRSNAKTQFCSTPFISFENCNHVKCINEYYDCIFNVTDFLLIDSKFDIQSTGQIFVVRPLPEAQTFQTSLGKERLYDSSIKIIENDSNCYGQMIINSDEPDKHIFPNASIPRQRFSAPEEHNPYDEPFKHIEIASKNNDLLQRIASRSGSDITGNYELDPTYLDGSYYTFIFNDGIDNPDFLKWKSFILTHTPKPEPSHHSSKHEVLNTGVY